MMVKADVVRELPGLNKLISDLIKSSAPEGCGALAIFIGYVKGFVEGHLVKELIYEAHESYAKRVLKRIADEVRSKYGVKDVVIIHRVGRLKPGEASVIIAVTSEGRDEAFKAAREALERVKHEAPIYKLEVRDDGEYWVMSDGRRVRRSAG